MTDVHIPFDHGDTWITFSEKFEPGDQPPSDYCGWHEWADVQAAAGLTQERCGRCCKWKFPQELSGNLDMSEAWDSKGVSLILWSPVCNECHQRISKPSP